MDDDASADLSATLTLYGVVLEILVSKSAEHGPATLDIELATIEAKLSAIMANARGDRIPADIRRALDEAGKRAVAKFMAGVRSRLE